MKTTRVAPVSGRSFVRKDSQTLTGLSTKPTVNEKQVGKVRKHSPDPNQLDERASCRLLWIPKNSGNSDHLDHMKGILLGRRRRRHCLYQVSATAREPSWPCRETKRPTHNNGRLSATESLLSTRRKSLHPHSTPKVGVAVASGANGAKVGIMVGRLLVVFIPPSPPPTPPP